MSFDKSITEVEVPLQYKGIAKILGMAGLTNLE